MVLGVSEGSINVLDVVDAKRDMFVEKGVVGNHRIFDDTGEISAGVHGNKSKVGFGGEFFKKKRSLFLGNFSIHFENPGSSFNIRKFTVGDDSNLYLNFIVKIRWE